MDHTGCSGRGTRDAPLEEACGSSAPNAHCGWGKSLAYEKIVDWLFQVEGIRPVGQPRLDRGLFSFGLLEETYSHCILALIPARRIAGMQALFLPLVSLFCSCVVCMRYHIPSCTNGIL